MEILLGGLAVAVLYSFMSLRVLRQYERGVAFFLGRYWGTKGPGVIFLPAGFAGQKRVSLRIVAMVVARSPRLYRRVQLLYVPSSHSLLSCCL